jgi:YD repeat-containing protein
LPTTNYYTVNGQIIGEKTTGGSRIDYMRDALGNVTGTLDQNAQVINRYRYKPYGELLAKTGTGPDPKFRWVGSWGYRHTSKRFSDVYVRARHYSSQLAQWTTVDQTLALRKTIHVRSWETA